VEELMTKDAFDQWWEWANKPAGSHLTIPADIHGAVIALDPEERKDRATVNEAVRIALDPNTPNVWIYEGGDHPETFQSEDEGLAWLEQNDPEGVLWKAPPGALGNGSR
jgi:hypothetical protein